MMYQIQTAFCFFLFKFCENYFILEKIVKKKPKIIKSHTYSYKLKTDHFEISLIK